jgi:CheY-like chemotaxis protein
MRILIAEDDKDSQQLIKRHLEKENYEVIVADNGLMAWEILQKEHIYFVITDWIMPEMNGIELCEKIRQNKASGYVYIILVTAQESKEDIIQAMDVGADDYITKPYDKGELLARVRSGQRIISLEHQLIEKNQELNDEKDKSESLLLNIFPKFIVDQLKLDLEIIAESYEDASILFAEIHNFLRVTAKKTPIEVVEILNKVFSCFDRLARQYELEKIKTIGDTYMVVAGVPMSRPDHATVIAEMALSMQKEIVSIDTGIGFPLQLRIGIDSGQAIAGVIGTSKYAYDVWGDIVTTASEMAAYGLPGFIQVTSATYKRLYGKYLFEERGEFYVHSKGAIQTFLLTGRKAVLKI